LGTNPQSQDSDSDGYGDADEWYAQTEITDSSDMPDSSTLPGGWNVSGVGNVAESKAYVVGEEWRLAANGNSADQCGFFYREFSGGYSMTFRVHGIDPSFVNGRIGVMMREETSSGSVLLTGYHQINGNRNYSEERLVTGGGIIGNKLSTVGFAPSELFMRLTYTPEHAIIEFSEDGDVWTTISESFNKFEPNTFAGVYLTANVGSGAYNRARVELIDIKEDSDFDGLWDIQELNEYGTDPLLSDTDGDGVPDGEELNSDHTDPLALDALTWGQINSIDMDSADELLGHWSYNSMGELSCNDLSGKVEFSFELDEPGIYRIRVPVDMRISRL